MENPVKVMAVHHYKGRTSVYREALNLSTPETRALEGCPDTPSDAFQNAWAALIPLALKLVELDRAKGWLGNAVVSKLAIGEKDQRRNFVLTVVRKFAAGAVTLNTPVRLERLTEETGPQYATDELTRAVDRVCALALEYADGAREQTALPLEQQQAEPSVDVGDDATGAPESDRALALV